MWTQTHKLIMNLSQNHTRWQKVLRNCHVCGNTRKMCVCGCSVFTPRRLQRNRYLFVSETLVNNLHGLKESVAFTPFSNLDCAIFLGVVRAILLNPTSAIVVLQRGQSSQIPQCNAIPITCKLKQNCGPVLGALGPSPIFVQP